MELVRLLRFLADVHPTVETVGYGARAYAHYKVDSTIAYAVQSLFILLAPILFAASVYMYLGRIITAVEGEEYCLIRARFLTKIFVCGDIFCFLVQGSGGGLMSGAKTAPRLHLGENVILAGLVLQIVIFLFFCTIALAFHIRMRGNHTPGTIQNTIPWQRLLLGLYLVSVLITLRNVVRAIEYGMGQDGYFLEHEWTTYVFDAAPMAVVLAICMLWYNSGVGERVRPHSLESAIPLESRK